MNLKQLKKSKLGQSFKLTTRCLYTGLIMIVLAVVFYIWAYFAGSVNQEDAKDFSDLLASSSVEEKVYTKLNVTFAPEVFAEYEDKITSDKYYFLWNGELLNIGYLDYGTYKDLVANTSGVESDVIYGITKKLPDDVIELAIDAYNEKAGENFLTLDNYDQYIGKIYIDTVSPVHDTTFQLIGGFIFAILGLTILVIGIIQYRQTKKEIASRTEQEWEKILKEIDADGTKHYKKLNLYLTDHYIIDAGNGFHIIEYPDIVWMYQFEMKQYGLTTNKNIVIATNKKKKVSIARMDNFVKRSKKDYTEIMDFIISKNPAIALGYTKENREQMKNLYGIK